MSPIIGTKTERQNKILKKGDSNDSIKQIRLPGQPKISDFTVSSNEYAPNQQDGDNDDGNSIISEEDSAFEDQTPHHGQAAKKRSEYMKEMKIQKGTLVELESKSHLKIEGDPRMMKDIKR